MVLLKKKLRRPVTLRRGVRSTTLKGAGARLTGVTLNIAVFHHLFPSFECECRSACTAFRVVWLKFGSRLAQTLFCSIETRQRAMVIDMRPLVLRMIHLGVPKVS